MLPLRITLAGERRAEGAGQAHIERPPSPGSNTNRSRVGSIIFYLAGRRECSAGRFAAIRSQHQASLGWRKRERQARAGERAVSTMSGSHLSKDFFELVKAIGESKSKQEEDRIIMNEVGVLKKKMPEANVAREKMKEFLVRMIYVEMLGHDASFAYIKVSVGGLHGSFRIRV